jgi:hypothetical protein
MAAARPCGGRRQLAGDRNAARLFGGGLAPSMNQASLICRSGLGRDRQAASCRSGVLLSRSKIKINSVSFRPADGPSHFLLLAQEEVTKEKGTPVWRLPGILPSRSAFGLRGFADSASCAGRTLAHPCARPCGPCSTPARRQTGAPLIGLPGRTASKITMLRIELALSRVDMFGLAWPLRAWVPSAAPSNAASFGGKARMSEGMDARVRAGPKLASSAGHRHCVAVAARKGGRLLFGYFLLAKQEKVTRAVRRTERNAFAPASKHQSAPAARRSPPIANKLAPTEKRRIAGSAR